jgi:hypothetical protein
MSEPSVNFVIFGEKWADLLAGEVKSISEVAARIILNEDVWSVLTYLQMRKRGLCASLSSEPLPDRINIVDGIRLEPERTSPEMFLVGCRGDGHYPGICQAVIQQNLITDEDEPSIYIPQWAQPGLIPRSPSRAQIRNIGFLGHHAINLAKCFREAAFVQDLRALGCELLIKGKSDTRVSWNDYSDLDLVLAVRDIPETHLRLKPVNKLTNAWMAGVPAMIGVEPAVELIRMSPLDCIAIRQPADVFQALQTLHECGGLYENMVKHGRRRAAEYADEAIAGRWFHALECIRDEFRRWKRMPREHRIADHNRRLELSAFHLTRHVEGVHRDYARQGYGPNWWATA